ncbi:frataxin, mitochondrial [Gossypium raimondii]|uniref:ferroxidase n=1 Tax=Gossypium raimondii TaxID=29730 RepID=A0A0D2SKT2_GOSRA|nr:frataxin, mitochondrial [Gossypium raimondii]KJB31760.1 hypothetical protein B456_005G207400 [Gossypium raimondii]
MTMASRLTLLRRISKLLLSPSLSPSPPLRSSRLLFLLRNASRTNVSPWPFASSRSFCSDPLNLPQDSHGPAPIDYRSVLPEDEFHRIANSTIHDLQEKLEEYGDIVDMDGFDVDYGNEVLTLKLGALGTYVMNKQTPNRQIWLSSPISGPSRFDWDHDTQAWVYRRTKANLFKLLESELEQLCGEPVNLS